MNLNSNAKVAISGIVAAMAVSAAFAQAAYQVPYAGPSTPYYSSSLEYGNEITSSGGTLSSLSFDYYANYAQAGGLLVRMYDFTGGTPGALLYQSNPLNILNKGGQVNLTFANQPIPTDVAFTVQFSGISLSQAAGLLNPGVGPSVGSGPNKVWVYDGTSWGTTTLGANSYFTASLNQQFIPTVPEPATYALGGLGALLLLGASAYRRSQK